MLDVPLPITERPLPLADGLETRAGGEVYAAIKAPAFAKAD
jgi:hypothetical protein